MSLTTSLISVITGVDEATARRAWNTLSAQDDLAAPAPAEFRHGVNARCYALAVVAQRSPGRFWGFFAAVVAIPVLLLLKWVI
jgi:hypothetical protein